jgi:phage gpG-like protein
MYSAEINVTGLDQTLSKLAGIKRVFSGFKPELQASGDYLMKYYENTPFQEEGANYGQRWQALSPKYEAWKRSRYGNKPILVRTGAMQKSFKLTTTDSLMKIENTAEYFPYHQSSAPRRKIPRRVVLMLTDILLSSIGDEFKKSLMQRIQRAL